MAKKTFSIKSAVETHPFQTCLVLTIVALGAGIAGLILKNPLIVMAGLVPLAVYEAIRTWGVYTKFASVLLVVVLAAEIVLIIFNVNFNLAKYLGGQSEYVAGYSVPLGDIKVVAPVLLIILSVILAIRTAGPYTKWLALVITVSSSASVYVLSPSGFPGLVKWGVKQIISFASYLN
jgi:hypothetical protein